MVRSLACLLLIPLSGPALASGELVVARMGARDDASAEQRGLDAAAGPARRPERRIRIVDLRAPDATLGDVRLRQLPQVLALRPAVVTLSLGSTDLCADIPLRTFARELHVVTDLLRRNAKTVAVSTFSPPDERCARTGPGLRRRLEAFNATVVQTATRNKVLVVDVGANGNGAPGSLDPALVAEIEEALVRGREATPAPPPRARQPRDREEL